MSVKPEQADGLVLFLVVRHDTGKRSDRDGVIAAEYQRQLPGFKYYFNFAGQLLAGVADLANVFEFVIQFRERLWTFEPHVAEILNRVSQSRDTLVQTCDT